MLSEALKKEFEYYLAHQEEIVAQYDGRVVVIKGCQVIGDYEDYLDAITDTKREHESGTFLPQKVSAGDSEYTVAILNPLARF